MSVLFKTFSTPTFSLKSLCMSVELSSFRLPLFLSMWVYHIYTYIRLNNTNTPPIPYYMMR